MAKKQMLPETIQILGKPFQIRYIANLKDKTDPEELLYGATHGREFQIDINSSYPIDIQRKTLFHEAMHGALAVAGLTHLLDDKIEEAIISCFEHAFADHIDMNEMGIK